MDRLMMTSCSPAVTADGTCDVRSLCGYCKRQWAVPLRVRLSRSLFGLH